MTRRTCPRCGDPAAVLAACWRCGTPSTPNDDPHPLDLHVGELYGYGLRNEPAAVECKHHFGWTLHRPGPSDLPGAAYLGELQLSPWLLEPGREHVWVPSEGSDQWSGSIVFEHAGADGRPPDRRDLRSYWFSTTYRRYFPHGTLARAADGATWVFAEHGRSEHHLGGFTVADGKWRRVDDPLDFDRDLPDPWWTYHVDGDGELAARVALVVDRWKSDLWCMRDAWLGGQTVRQAWSSRHGCSKITVTMAHLTQQRVASRVAAELRSARADEPHDYEAKPPRASVEEVWELLGVRAQLEAQRRRPTRTAAA